MNPKTAPSWYRFFAALLLLAMFLSACTQATPEPPKPTLPPLPAPKLLERVPAPGEEQALDAPIQLVFDQPMDRTSVEAAFHITPTVGGEFKWTDSRTADFYPANGLQRATSYHVSVGPEARNAEGKVVFEPVAFNFQTTGFLAVSEVQPVPNTTELSPDTAVTVIFNRPVVPLTAIDSQGELPNPLSFDPPVAGKAEWLNTSILLFRPDGGFLPATHYTARVAAGLTDTTGGVLPEDYTWTFTTIQPAVQDVRPYDGFQYVGPTAAISVTFNQPMDHSSAEASFSLVAGRNTPIAGTFQWQGGATPFDLEVMIFNPSTPLPRSSFFTAQLAAGALARGGGAGVAGDTTWQFQTVNEPGVVSSYPVEGMTGSPPYEDLAITFASPMDTKAFTETLTITPPVSDVYVYWTEYDTQAGISFAKAPQTSYTVSLSAATPDKYGAPLGQSFDLHFTTGDLDPLAMLNPGGMVATVSAYTNTVFYVTYRNVTGLDLALYRLSLDNFIQFSAYDWDAWNNFNPPEADLVRRWSQPVEAPANETRFARVALTDNAGAELPPGLYYLEETAPEIRRLYPGTPPNKIMIVRSALNLTLKQSRSETLLWATDLSTGQPVVDLPVTFYRTSTTALGQGTTGSDGVLTTEMATDNLWDPLFAATGEQGQANFGLAFNNWSDGISPWDFSLDSEYYGNQYLGYLYTERPIYRPGQTVYFKGIIRADDDAHYSLPSGMTEITVQFRDAEGNDLGQQTLPVSDMGTFNGELALAQEASLGYYTIEVLGQAFYASANFQVAEYRRPEYQVSVTADRDAYLSGDTINVTAQASYYFGGAVANAAVHWSVLSDDSFFYYECPQGESCPWYDWTDYDWSSFSSESYSVYGELIASGDATTDAQGQVTFQVPADITKRSLSQRFTIEASVTDINDQQVSNRTTVLVHKGEYYIGLAPRGYLATVGEEKQVDILTAGWESEAVADIPLTVVFYEHRWYSTRKTDESGDYFWDWTTEDIPVLTTTVTTGSDGKAVAAFTPDKAGSYRVRAIGRDTHENEIRSSTFFWVSGGEYVSWRQESNNRINLIADKKEYQVGDTAEILIPSPYQGSVQALITIERGHIISSEVRELTSNSEVLHIPIPVDYVPDVFVSVLIVQGSKNAPDRMATFKMGEVRLPVVTVEKELNITLTPDKPMDQGEHYGPRQTATYDILTTDYAGNPVEAELSLRLADLAVLSLANDTGPSLMATFWRTRGLGTRTSTPLVVALEQFNRELKPGAKGGGGGADEEQSGLVRTNFADTAYWAPNVRTDKDGKAQVQVTLPDNLTTWRMQARGITADTLVGQTDVDVLSTLDLLVRPILPRFFVVGDKAEIGTIVHNNSKGPLSVEVELDVEGLTLDGANTRTVDIPAGDKVRVDWPVSVPGVDQVKVEMSARAGDISDAREDTLPVYHYSTPEVVATAGRISEPEARQEIIQLPKIYDPTQGELTVQVDGSLTAATKDALDYLEHYPYECTEQTVSRFLPNVLTFQALKEMGISRPELEQQLNEMASIGLQRLYAQQHYDGGWGWWVDDETNAYLTAYVLQALMEAQQAGFTVDPSIIFKGADYLAGNLPEVSTLRSNWQANRLAYMLYVLAEYDATAKPATPKSNLSLAVSLFEKRHLLDNYGRAILAMAFGLLEPDEPSRADTLLGDLSSQAIVSATGTHWEEKEPDYWNMNTDVRSTAIVLWAMSRLQPKSDLLPNVTRWLMSVRKEGHWESTQDTAWSLLGLIAYMRASGEMQGDYSYAVYLNGELKDSGDVNKTTIDESHKLQIEIQQLLVDEANRLIIERKPASGSQSGKGQLYYTAFLRYFLPADLVKALDRGVIVARQYSLVNEPDTAVTSAKVGDVIKVRLTIIAPTDLYYVAVEDPLPAGCEAVDTSLNTTSIVGEQPELHNLTAEQQDEWYHWYGWGWWWFSHTEMRDEKVVLFSSYLPRGTYEYTYLMRASVPGEFLVMPSNAYQMYFPEVFGRSDGGKFVVTQQ